MHTQRGRAAQREEKPLIPLCLSADVRSDVRSIAYTSYELLCILYSVNTRRYQVDIRYILDTSQSTKTQISKHSQQVELVRELVTRGVRSYPGIISATAIAGTACRP